MNSANDRIARRVDRDKLVYGQDGKQNMATSARSRSSAATDIQDRLMPWVLITEIYWMSYKLLERRFYHLGV
jgi:hypothetical protein